MPNIQISGLQLGDERLIQLFYSVFSGFRRPQIKQPTSILLNMGPLDLIAQEEEVEQIMASMRNYLKDETIEDFRRLCPKDFYEKL